MVVIVIVAAFGAAEEYQVGAIDDAAVVVAAVPELHVVVAVLTHLEVISVSEHSVWY